MHKRIIICFIPVLLALTGGFASAQNDLPPPPPGLLLPNGVEVQAIPAESIPFNGTFLSLQFSNNPPLPWNFALGLDVTVYPLPDGSMVVNDLSVDYEALLEEAQWEQALRS